MSTRVMPHRNPKTGHEWWIAISDDLTPSAIDVSYEGICEQVAQREEAEKSTPRRNPTWEQKPMPPNMYGIPLDVLEAAGNYREFWPPLVVSYGLGVDSTAVLVGLRRLGLVPSAIVFADTGAEKPETYSPGTNHIANYYPGDPRDYYSIISDWLRWAGFPPITVVRLVPPIAPYRTLEEQGLYTQQLPSLAMGFHRHGCSIKWKGEVIDKFIATQWPMYQEARAHGVRPIRLIGYDDSTADMKRARRFAAKAQPFQTFWDPSRRVWVPLPEPEVDEEIEEDDEDVEEVVVATPAGPVKKRKKRKPIGEWAWWYPLQTWGWDRERCKAEIAAEGLPVPNKSACFFCPAMQPEEVDELMDRYPELAARIERLEANAEAGGKLTTIRGLWGAHKMSEYMQQRREQLRGGAEPSALGYRGARKKKLPTVR